MQAATLLLVAICAVFALFNGQVLLAGILFLVLVAMIIYFLAYKAFVGAKNTSKVLTKGVMTDLEKAKGQSPKGSAEFAKVFEAAGAKVGENAWAKSNQTYRSEDLLGRIGQGSKNLLDGLGRLFK